MQVKKKYELLEEQPRLAALKKDYGNHKNLPEGYELAALLALENYPIMKEVALNFCFEKDGHRILSATPYFTTVLRKPFKRRYKIIINTRTYKHKNNMLLNQLDFNMQIGQLAHEMAHIYDYLHKNTWQLIATGLKYLFSKSYKSYLESYVDTVTIRHGYGWQLLEFAEKMSLMAEKYPDEKYISQYFSYYMSPGAIRQLMDTLDIYHHGILHTA